MKADKGTSKDDDSGSLRRLTSLSIHNAGCNEDYEEASTTEEESRAHLSDDGDDENGATGREHRKQLYPTPGSTAHTGSTSSLSSLSIASMNNISVAREVRERGTT